MSKTLLVIRILSTDSTKSHFRTTSTSSQSNSLQSPVQFSNVLQVHGKGLGRRAPANSARSANDNALKASLLLRTRLMHSSWMLLFLASALEQLDLALEHIAKGDVHNARFSLMPTDNAVELVLHQVARDKVSHLKMFSFTRGKYEHQEALDKALGRIDVLPNLFILRGNPWSHSFGQRQYRTPALIVGLWTTSTRGYAMAGSAPRTSLFSRISHGAKTRHAPRLNPDHPIRGRPISRLTSPHDPLISICWRSRRTEFQTTSRAIHAAAMPLRRRSSKKNFSTSRSKGRARTATGSRQK